MSKPRLIVAFLSALSFATVAFPCGDKLSAMPGGVRFERLHAARHPGRVLIFTPLGSPLRVDNEGFRLAETVRRAGHLGQVVDEQGLQLALQLSTADLFLVDDADKSRFDAIAASGKPVAVLRVSSAGAAARVKFSPRSKCVTRLTKRSNPSLLRAIDDSFGRRLKGKSAECEDKALTRGT
jgi:hypothetical protein